MAEPQRNDEEAEVRDDQREEAVDIARGPLQGLPGRVFDVPQLLPPPTLRRGAELRIPPRALPQPLPLSRLQIR